MCPNSDLGPAISMHNELIVRANWVDNFNCMWAFWQLILCPLFVDSFFPCVYLLQHYSWGSPVARDSHTYVGGGCSVCMWLAQHAKKTAAEAKPECPQLCSSLPLFLSICSPSPRKSVASCASDTLTNSLLISCVCVWWNETKGGTHRQKK